jgi:hypothetical protein
MTNCELFDLWSHYKIVFTTQIHAGIELRRGPSEIPQPQVSGGCDQMHLHFNPGKQFTDALPRACGKREHRERVPIPRLIWLKPIWIEAIGIFPDGWVSLD